MTLDELISEVDGIKSALCDAEFATTDRQDQITAALDDMEALAKSAREFEL